MQSWVYGNGLAYRRTLSADYRPGVVEDGPVNGVGPGISLGYEFDAVGNLWKLRDGKQAEPPLRVYAYDGLDRLTAARDAAGTDQQTYAYDRTGNRTASGYWQVTGISDCSGVPPGDPCTPGAPVSAWKTRTYDYVPQKHHLWTIGYTERHYDATGNTIWIGPKSVEQPPGDGDPGPGDPGGGETESAAYAGTEQSMIGLDDGGGPPPGIVEKTFVYNASNRLASVSDGGVLTMSYRYNGAGERVYRTGSGKTVHTVFDTAGHWIGDYDGYGQPLQQAIWLGDLPVGLVARIDGLDRLFYVEPDALGSPRVVIDPTRNAANGGMAVWRWPLMGDAFGEEAPYEDPDGDSTAFVLDLRFPGQQYDSATGFNYNYFRDYDATTGRYVQSDPIGLSGGISSYAYVSGDPLAWIDPNGLLQWAILQTEVRNNADTGTRVSSYTGATRQSSFGPGTLALTSIDWEIKSECTCGDDGNYSLEEFSVSFTPRVTLRRRYSSSHVSAAVRRNEQDHVNDFSVWATGARANAEALEQQFKKRVFPSQGGCKSAAQEAMQQYLYDDILPTLIESHRRWDAGGTSAPHYVPNAWD